MEWKMTLLNEREKGRAEGREEGREEGRAEGRKQGRKEGREEGREEGRAEGVLFEQIDTIIKKIRKGRNLSETAEEMEKDQEMIRPVWEAVKAQAPEYDREKIFRSLLK